MASSQRGLSGMVQTWRALVLGWGTHQHDGEEAGEGAVEHEAPPVPGQQELLDAPHPPDQEGEEGQGEPT